jgi:hypothetical protein
MLHRNASLRDAVSGQDEVGDEVFPIAKHELRRLARKRNLAPRPRLNSPAGKSLPIFRNHVNPSDQKYSA